MDAIQLLLNDHQKVEGIFQQFEQGGNAEQFTQLFTQLYQELTLHSLVEEAVFYPALAAFPELSSLLKEAYKEQAEVKATFGELAALDNTTTQWSDRMNKLMRDTLNHVQLEQDQIFPRARQLLGEQKLQTLGQQLEKAKQINLPGVQSSLPMMEIQQRAGLNTGVAMPSTQSSSQYIS